MIISCVLLIAAAEPDWVQNGGGAAKYPAREYLTGFAVVEGDNAESAKTQAAAQLAQQVSVRIESDTSEVSAEKNGKEAYAISSFTRASSDVRMSGLRFETHATNKKLYALAILSRQQAMQERQQARDLALAQTKESIASGERLAKTSEGEAMRAYLAARLALAQALEDDAVARAVAPGSKPAIDEAAALQAKIAEHLGALVRKPVSTLDDCTAAIAFQLSEQGIGRGVALTIAPLTYGTTAFSSVFGRQIGSDIESQLARTKPVSKPLSGTLAFKGTYTEVDGLVRVVLIGRDAQSGRTVASAEAAIKKTALPKDLALVPQNLQQALLDQKILGQGEEVSGALRVEAWTQKGHSNLVYRAKEELKFFLRVNRPAWVRIVYLLASGAKVPVTQAYFIDASKVNLAVEYPETFEVSAPFGAERVQVVAFTEQPEPLPTEAKVFDGERYDVVRDTQTLVKHRGLQRKKVDAQTAETSLTLTTMP